MMTSSHDFHHWKDALEFYALFSDFTTNHERKWYATQRISDHVKSNLWKELLIAVTQQSFYSKEISGLLRKENLNKKNSISSLNPFLDADNILRVGGRINNSELSYEAKHPIIIPTKSHLANLIIHFSHKILLHAEFQIMIRAIR